VERGLKNNNPEHAGVPLTLSTITQHCKNFKRMVFKKATERF
jgi:hypothetical protein